MEKPIVIQAKPYLQGNSWALVIPKTFIQFINTDLEYEFTILEVNKTFQAKPWMAGGCLIVTIPSELREYLDFKRKYNIQIVGFKVVYEGGKEEK